MLHSDVKARLSDVYLDLNVRRLSHHYFDHSASWLYHKLDGIDGNGGVGGFTDEELEQLRAALLDFSARIRAAAEAL